jgi:hypothetical protein
MQPAFGQRAAWLMLTSIAAATIAGFQFSSHLLPLAGEFAISVIQAIVIGTIIHTLAHRGHMHSSRHSHDGA